MVVIGVIAALLMALLPVLIFVTLRSRPGRPTWLLALDVPAAMAIDLVGTVLLSRLVVLDLAAWIARVLWLAGGLSLFLYRRRRGWRPVSPIKLGDRVFFQALLVGTIGLLVSLTMSRPCAIWDRPFHVPLLSSMRGQTAPFATVYEPWKQLYYHYGGDLFAACLQAYSFGIIHGSHALSLVHDICFFWLGVTTTLVLREMGLRQTTLQAAVYLAMLLSGPVTPVQGEHRPFFAGYSLVNYLSISFRPYVSMGALASLPFFAVPLVRLRQLERDVNWRDLFIPLFACVPLLVIVDEFSVGTLGLALGSVWLLYPRVFAPTRRQGLYLFGGLALALVFGALTLKGTIGPGAPHYPLKLVVPRSPGFYSDPLSLSTAIGLRYFLADLFPILALLVLGGLMFIRNRDAVHVGSYAVYATVALVSVFLFSTLVYNGSGLQNHRFVTVPMLFAPLFVAAWVTPRPEGRTSVTGTLELGLIAAVALAAASCLAWLGEKAPSDCRAGNMSLGFYAADCRALTGAGLVTERTRPVYADPQILYLYAGCRPGFMVGPASGMDGHDLKVGTARLSIDALQEMHRDPRFLPANANLTVICPRAATSDPACTLLAAAGGCRPAGTELAICSMTPAQRTTVVGGLPAK